jgi:hypothetical protein
MRRFSAASLALLLAACATAPKPGQVTQIPESEHTRGGIIGLTAEDLIHRLGAPALQIREGESLKFQFRSDQCVLDAYLYPSGNAPYRVTYVDARTRSLGTIDQALCIQSIAAP